MIQRALGVIAGVDRKTLSTCPASDKLWAAHLGASLCLSFIVVLGVSYHATGYMIASVWTRLLVSGVIALTVLMFDRALCQSDWFYQGTLWNTAPIQSSAEARQTAWRFVRVGIRLLMSFGLAWVIAMFLELAIFSGTINEKIEADRVAANQPIYAKIAQYEAGLNAESARRQAGIDALQALHRDALTETPAAEPNLQTRNDDIEQQIKALVAREADIRADIGEIDRTIQRYVADMNAEEFGLKAAPNNSGRPGAGPRYEFAKKQKDSFIAQRAAREAEIVQLHAKRDELRAEQSKIAAEALAARDQERSVIKAKADALQARIDAARADLKSFEADKVASIAEFRSKALAESYYQEKKDRVDPLTRIAAYQELKNDPKDGATMTLFSWMTRMFIIFLEIVPVIAKIFFSPPSVYAAKIQAQVERARQRIENNEDLDDDKPTEPAKPAAPAIAAIALPAMSLGAVEMNQPEPRRTERRHTAADDRIDRARSRDGGRYDDARETGDRDVRRHRFEGDIHRRDYAARDYARDDDRRSYAQDVHDDDRRGWHRRDFDRRDFNRRDVHRRDDRDRDETMPRHEMPRHEVARHEVAQHDVANRRPAQVVARDLAAHGFEAADVFRPDHDDRAFDASELDVRNLIMPRRGAVRREAMPHDVARESFGVRTAAPDVAEVTAEHPAPPAAAAIDDRQTRELVRQILVEADAPVIETPVLEELPPMPPREPDASCAVSSIKTAAEAEATTESPLPADQTAVQEVTDDVLAESKPAETAEAISPIGADPKPTSDSLGSASPQSPVAAPLIETATPPAAMSQDAAVAPGDAHHGSAGSPALKFSADVERLMSEAVELSKARKKAARARRDHPVAAEAELPLEPAPQYGDVPKA